MELLQIRCGGDRNFCYLLVSGGEAAVVDPGEDLRDLLRALSTRDCRLRYVLATHTHGDHTIGLPQLPRGDWQLVASARGALLPDRPVGEDPLDLPLGHDTLCLLPAPGHSPCSLCILVRDGRGRPTDLLTGDTLFVGKVGGTRSPEEGLEEYHSLQRVVLGQPDEVRIWPGHDVGVGPSSTLGHERRSNPFLLCPDPQAFLALKAGWADYKLQHGIR
jgi:hydroxyacylglutathione hydrolase